METKTCPTCKQNKPLIEFARNKDKKDGHSYQCKMCLRKYNKSHYENNKQKYIDKARKFTEKQRQYWQTYKSKLRCSQCGYNKCVAALDFHHPDNDKQIAIGTAISAGFSKKSILKEMKKCIVLCSNCHRELHFNEKNA